MYYDKASGKFNVTTNDQCASCLYCAANFVTKNKKMCPLVSGLLTGLLTLNIPDDVHDVIVKNCMFYKKKV